MRRSPFVLAGILLGLLAGVPATAGPATATAREVAEIIMAKFGRGAAGQTIEEVTGTTAKAAARYGDEVLPLVRSVGHQGFAALEAAGEKAPDVIRLYARRGDEAVWLISEPRKLSIFLKHGDSAADALIKHPGLADDLIGRFGGEAVGALNGVSRQGAQRLAIAADSGLLTATARSPELLSVIRGYGDEAMDFIWRNKGALAVAALLGKFLADPEAYISGAKQLLVDPVLAPIAQNTNWTLLFSTALLVAFLPFIARRISVARSALSADRRK